MINFERFVLENGLRVLVHTDRSTPIVAVNLLYDVGSRDEDRQKTGLAHLFEHLMFGGSQHIQAYDASVQMISGDSNAFTSSDYTNYYITLPAVNIETAFWLESDRMLGLDFSQKNLDIQRRVVIEEFRQRYLNQPYGDAMLLLLPLAYHHHPYGWPVIGREIAHIEQADLPEVKQFFYQYYAPNNAIMVVAGNLTPKQVENLSKKWFLDIPRREIPKRQIKKEPPQIEARHLHVEREVPFNAIYKAFHTCNRLENCFYACDLLADLLHSGKSSRLYRRLVSDLQLFSHIHAQLIGNIEHGLLVLAGHLKDEVPMETAEAAINETLAELYHKPVSNYELQKLQNQTEASLIFAQSNILNKAINLAYHELLGDADQINKLLAAYKAVDADMLLQAAQKIFRPENCSTLYYHAIKTKN